MARSYLILGSLLLVGGLAACEKMPLDANVKGFIEAPFTVSGVSPSSGPSGTRVLLFGEGLGQEKIAVAIDGAPFTTYSVEGSDRLSLTLPDGPPGLVRIIVSMGMTSSASSFIRTGENGQDMFIPGGDPSQICKGTRFIDEAGQVREGQKACSSKEENAGGSDEDPTPESRSFSILSPSGVQLKRNVEITWERSTAADDYLFGVARKKNCTDLVQPLKPTADRRGISGNLGDGNYFACVVARSKGLPDVKAENQGAPFSVDASAPGAGIVIEGLPSLPTKDPTWSLTVGGAAPTDTYKFKYTQANLSTCAAEDGYSFSPRSVGEPFDLDFTQRPDGEYRICVVVSDEAGNTAGLAGVIEQSLIMDRLAPSAWFENFPSSTNQENFEVHVLKQPDLSHFKARVGMTPCSVLSGYSDPIPVDQPFTYDFQGRSDGPYYFCLMGMDLAGNQQDMNYAGYWITYLDRVPPTPATITGFDQHRIGRASVYLDFSPSLDVDRVEVRVQPGITAPADCDSGVAIPKIYRPWYYLGAHPNYGTGPNLPYSFRACSYDAAGNVASTVAQNVLSSNSFTTFATSEWYFPDMTSGHGAVPSFANGYDGADYRCQNSADTYELGGYWKAVISGGLNGRRAGAWTRLTGPVYNYSTSPQLVANDHAEFFSSAHSASVGYSLNRYAYPSPSYSWTGNHFSDDGNACGEWTTRGLNASVGDLTALNSTWNDYAVVSCTNYLPLVCIEQERPAPAKIGFQVVATDPTDVEIKIDFPASTAYHHVDLVEVPAGISNANCDASGSTLIKAFDGSGEPFIDTKINHSTGTRNVYYSLCVYDLDQRLVDQQASVKFMHATKEHRIFVTSEQFTGDLTQGHGLDGAYPDALTGADARCQHLADAAVLSGSWIGLISTSVEDAFSRSAFIDTNVVKDMQNNVLAVGHTDLWNHVLMGPNFDESGTYYAYENVWTGSWAGGSANANCTDFTSTSGGGTVGQTVLSPLWMLSDANFACSTHARLYCLEQ